MSKSFFNWGSLGYMSPNFNYMETFCLNLWWLRWDDIGLTIIHGWIQHISIDY